MGVPFNSNKLNIEWFVKVTVKPVIHIMYLYDYFKLIDQSKGQTVF